MKNPNKIHLSELYIRLIDERGGIMSVFYGATVAG
jgi:hypothetical protein